MKINAIPLREVNALVYSGFTWVNPRPELPIVAIDFVSALTEAVPFLVALTVEK